MTIFQCSIVGPGSPPVFLSKQELISPTNLCNARRRKEKVSGAKDATLFHPHLWSNFSAYFMLQLLRRPPYFGTFLPNIVAIKSIKNYLRISCSSLAMKMLVKLTLDGFPMHYHIRSDHFPCYKGWNVSAVYLSEIVYGFDQFVTLKWHLHWQSLPWKWLRK